MSIEKEVAKAVEYLKQGKVILYPTDTIWGIGCDATNYKAVERIYKIKQRKENKSLIIILHSQEQLQDYVEQVPPVAYDLMKKIDTPLTIIYPGAKNLAKNVIADDKTIAIRIVKYDFCSQMLASFGKAVVSTSANLSGGQPPLVFSRVSKQIVDSVDFAVDFDRDRMNLVKPSTIIKIERSGEFRIIRN